MSVNIADLRENYTRAGLDREDLDPSPFKLFERWFQQAIAAELPEPNAMILGTADATGRVYSRTVLLKAYDDRGFVFYTNYQSAKAHQLESNNFASLTFPWFPIERQVNITGTTERVSKTESLKYFLSRPRGSQLGAWVSHQSEVITSRNILEMKLEEMKRKFAEGKIPLPDNWGGIRVIPDSIEFWQGRPNRLHDRFRYNRSQGDWTIKRLSP